MVKQLEKMGCGVACVAHVLGITYEEARKLWGKRTFDVRGMGLPALDRRLAHAGFAVQRVFRTSGKPWPPSPWAECHICTVDTDQKHPASGKKHHFVVMDVRGRVFDPDHEGDWMLKDYAYVHNVAAVIKVELNVVAALGNLWGLNDRTAVIGWQSDIPPEEQSVCE
jgi:hypothetical protein